MARVLVVDDSRIARAIARQALTGHGHIVLEAASMNAALDVLDEILSSGQAPVEMIVLDWNMPGGNGLEFLHVLRSRPDTATTPVLFATSEADPRRMGYAEHAGADGYLLKPYTEDQLIAAVQRALR